MWSRGDRAQCDQVPHAASVQRSQWTAANPVAAYGAGQRTAPTRAAGSRWFAEELNRIGALPEPLARGVSTPLATPHIGVADGAVA